MDRKATARTGESRFVCFTQNDNQNVKGNDRSEGTCKSRFPEGTTERKASATTRPEADPCGMTAREAKAKAHAKATALVDEGRCLELLCYVWS
jgi:hypothetical protein